MPTPFQHEDPDEMWPHRVSRNISLFVELFLVPLTIAALVSVAAFLFLVTEL